MPWQLRKPELLVDEIRDIYEPRPDETFPYVGLEHINQQTLTLNGVGKSSDTQSSKRRFKTGDILFGTLRPYFRKVIKARFDGVCSTDIAVLRAKDPSDADFVLYFIANQGFIDHASAHSSGTRMPRANWKQLSQTKWPIPDETERRALGYFLFVYDDLIENNTRRIKILEEMAQRIYREWFVNFHYPGHEKVKMVKSELGMIPNGWSVTSVSEAVELNPRLTVPRGTIKPYVPMAGLNPDSMLIVDYEMRTGNSGAKFQNSDTLMARITPSLEHGKTAFVQFLDSDQAVAIGSTEFNVMRSKTVNPYFVYCLARNEDLRECAIKSMVGASGRQRVQPECFDSFRFPQPCSNLLLLFEETVEPTFKHIQCLWEQTLTLRQTRDLLLPKLISGELNVSELDIDVGEIMQ